MKQETNGALAGLRVLELATNVAGPFGSTLFAEFGAEVIKVEVPGTGDPIRKYAPLYNEKSLTWTVIGRNKKSVTLNLRKPKGQELLKRLVEVSDVLVENFRPGTMEKWGLGYDELKKANPKIIMSRISGFGQDGAYKNRAAFDRIAGGMGGMTYLTGFQDGPPVRVGLNVCDQIAGLFHAFGTMIALYDRDVRAKSEGQWIDTSLVESVFRMLEGVIAEYQKLGNIRERVGNQNEVVAPADNFLTKDGKWIVFVLTSDTLFERFLKVINREDLISDPRFEDNISRLKYRDALHAAIREWVEQKTLSEVHERFEERGIPYGLVYNAKDIYEDPQNRERGNIIEIQDQEIGPVEMQCVIPKLSATAGKVTSSAPILGEHNQEIYGGLLGLTDEEMEALREEEII